jgi:hypothetical protein
MSPMSLMMINGDGQQKEPPDDDVLDSLLALNKDSLLEEIATNEAFVDYLLGDENGNTFGVEEVNNNVVGDENVNGDASM